LGPASRWLKTPKLPNEPNLKTAPLAIPVSREEQPIMSKLKTLFRVKNKPQPAKNPV
jgi:hypothetical protein